MSKTRIETERFILKELTIEDASPTYLGWLSDETAQRFIVTAKDTKKINELKDYIKEKINRSNCLFLGIFVKDSGQHIGNLKFEPIINSDKSAVMGILVGEVSWRAKGVAGEVILASSNFLKSTMGILSIILGVEPENTPAIKSYEKIGFREFSNDHYKKSEKAQFMSLKL